MLPLTWGFLLCWLKNKYWSSRPLIICSPGWTNKAEQQNILSTALTLLSSGSGWRITEYQHSRKPWPYRRNALHKEKSLRCYRSSRSFSPSLLRRYDRDLLVNLSGGELCASHLRGTWGFTKCPDKFPRTHWLPHLLRKPFGTCSQRCFARGHFVNPDRCATFYRTPK